MKINYLQIKSVSCFIIILFITSSFAQKEKDYKHESLAEKIYIQTDSDVYTTDKTVWFKVIIANAATHNLKISSGLLYVDLINSKKEIIESKILKIVNGSGKGYFDLSSNYEKDVYLIRAYTQWNKNFDEKFITEKYIEIYSEGLPQNTANNTQKPVKVKKENKIDYADYTESFEVQFFPEGGKMIADLSSKIGFKALDINGKGVYVEGELLNDRGDVITNFVSNKLGMGSFKIKDVDVSENYSVKITKLKKITVEKFFKLPETHLFGQTLSINERKKIIQVIVSDNKNKDSKIQLKASVRGKNYFNENVNLINGQYIFSIPKKQFPEGIIVFTIFQNNQPISERLFFNWLKDNRLKIDTKLVSKEIKKREKIDFNFNVSSQDNNFVSSSTSILVFDKRLYGNMQNTRENILSYFLMSSDLKGTIEAPGAYFNSTDDLDIDALMLTQGWRNYKYISDLQAFKYTLEKKLSVKGSINVYNQEFKNKKVDFVLMNFGNDTKLYNFSVKVPGSFNLKIEDTFGDDLEFLIKPTGINKKHEKDFKIAINKPIKLKPKYNFVEPKILIDKDTIINKIVSENKYKSTLKQNYIMKNYGGNLLDEVVIDAYKMTPKRKEIFEKYGEPDVVIEQKEILENNNKYSTGLYSALIGFHDRVFIRKDIRRNYYAETTKGGKGHVNIVIVDGIPVKRDDYRLVQRIDPKEVTSFEIIDNPKGLRQLYATAFHTNVPYGPFQGSIIAIYTKAGKGLYGALDTKSEIKINSTPVFSIEKEFYVPSHDVDETLRNAEPDLRSTIYWNPLVFNEKDKSKTISFSHSDDIGAFIIVFESISENGKIGYKTLEYQVTD